MKTKMKHDRYLVYQMMNRTVEVKHEHEREKPVIGKVEQILRNIYEKTVEITIGGNVYRFREPAIMTSVSSDILFIYGDASVDMTDDEMFAKMKSGEDYGQNIDEMLFQTRPSDMRTVRFKVSPDSDRRKSWRKKQKDS